MSPLIGLAGIAFSLFYVFQYRAQGFDGYFDGPSLVLLGVAPPCIMLLSHTILDFVTGTRILVSALFSRIRRHHSEVIDTLSTASKSARSEGLGAILPIRNNARYPLLRDGLSLIINDFKAEEIRHNLKARIEAKQSHMLMASNLFENMSKVCPGVGMIGTLIGLIRMLSNMEDPSGIGAGMALAMITTLYGLLLGTVIYAPWGEKIALEAEKSLEVDMLVLEGVLNIKGKKSSAHLKDIMKTYGSASGKGKSSGGGSSQKQGA